MELRRSWDRFSTPATGRHTRHSFSFGTHYDPTNVSFGELVAHNDDVVQPGAGYPEHPHRDLEIVTWVIDGALRHADSRGHSGVVTPGVVQAMSAGDGVLHSETVDSASQPTRFIQSWVQPDQPGGSTDYSSGTVAVGSGWTPLASGSHPDAATRIRARAATLWIARLASGDAISLPEVGALHLFVAQGSATTSDFGQGVLLQEGDALRGAPDDCSPLIATTTSELLVWTFDR